MNKSMNYFFSLITCLGGEPHMSESSPVLKFRVGESEIQLKPTDEHIQLAIVIRNKEDVVIKKTENGELIVGIQIPAYYGVTLALTSLIAYNKYRKKQKEQAKSKKSKAVDIDELFSEIKTKKKESASKESKSESEAEESLIGAME